MKWLMEEIKMIVVNNLEGNIEEDCDSMNKHILLIPIFVEKVS